MSAGEDFAVSKGMQFWGNCFLTNGTVLSLGRIDLGERQFWSSGVRT